MPSSWYLIHTKPQQEQTALLNLERQNYKAYLPMHRHRRRRAAQYQWLTESLFPRYLFIQLSEESDNWSPIRSTRGVANLVRFGGMSAKVPDEMIAYLQSQENARLQESDAVLEKGDAVEVVDGVMAGYQGIFEASVSSERASILLSIANRYTTVQISLKSLEKQE